MKALLHDIKNCRLCEDVLPLPPRPVMNAHSAAKIIITGQAPGRKVHASGVMWSDASGERLRGWLGVEETLFHNPLLFAHLPMGFCYPGKTASGDAPPRPECAPLWHPAVLQHMQAELHLLIGQYAQRYYLKRHFKGSLTETVKHFREYLPRYFPLPHPSPRNRAWFTRNPWFEREVVPELERLISAILHKKDPA